VVLDLPDGTSDTYRWSAGPAGSTGPAGPARSAGDAAAADTAGERRIPVSYRGKHVGALCLPGSEERRLAPDRRALLSDLADSVGVILHNASLSIQLQHSLREYKALSAEIQASRWRIVAGQDAGRRGLERDLHDGAQPTLTGVRLTLGLASHMGQAGNTAGAQRALGRLRDQIADALARLHMTLHGLDPQIISLHELDVALRGQAEVLGAYPLFRITAGPGGPRASEASATPKTKMHYGDSVPTAVPEQTVATAESGAARGDGPARGEDAAQGQDVALGEGMVLDPVVGAAVYLCCTEALQNTVKHCPQARVEVRIHLDTGARQLRFTVADTGPGFDVAAVADGSGLQNMTDRISAVGGDLTVHSEPGQGTRVTGWVPVTLEVPAPAGEPAAK
jgi:signal transduction histidine kinase